MTTVPPFDEYTVRDAKTGEVRKDHTHPYCTIGAELSDSGDYFSHDHYCMIDKEGCDEPYCFGDAGWDTFGNEIAATLFDQEPRKVNIA
jgi:hypothetical protein